MRRRALLTGVAAGTTSVLAGCVGSLFGDRVTRTDHRTYDVAADTPLRVENRNGDVTVESHDGSSVQVDVEFHAPSESALDDISLVGERRGSEFVVETTYAEGSDGRGGASVTARVPSAVSLAGATTTNGDVGVTDVAGGGEFASENGDVDVRRVDVADVATTNGDATVRDVETFGGAVTTNGDVAVDVPAPLRSDVAVRTENGDVSAALSPDLDAVVDATTTNGSVDARGVDLQDASTGEAHVSGTLGDGTFDVTVTTTNGDVELVALE